MNMAGHAIETFWNQVKTVIGEDDWATPEATAPLDNDAEALGQPAPETADAGKGHVYRLQSFAACLAIYKSVRYKDCRPFPGKWGIFINQQAVEDYAESDQPILAGLLGAYLQSHFHYDVYSMQAEALGRRPLYRIATSQFAPHRGLIDVRAAYDAMRWAQDMGQQAYAQGFFHGRQMHVVADSQIPALNTYLATALLEGTTGLFKKDDALRHEQQHWLDCLPTALANDCPVHHIASGETTTDNRCRIAPCSVVPVLATPLDFQPAADGNYYLFGADIEALSQLPAYAKLPIDTNGEAQYGNGLELGDKHISIAFSNLSSLQNIEKLVKRCGAFDMRHSVVRSHILGLMLLEISGEIYTDLGKDVADILNKWKNRQRRGVLGVMAGLVDIGRDDLAKV